MYVDQGAYAKNDKGHWYPAKDPDSLTNQMPCSDLTAKNVDLMLPSNLIPPSLFADNFEVFVDERAKLLVAAANGLMGRLTAPPAPPARA